MTTLEQYPLSVNVLRNACNQKSSRDPVMELDESSVREAITSLTRWRSRGASGRTGSGAARGEDAAGSVDRWCRRFRLRSLRESNPRNHDSNSRIRLIRAGPR
ncbi:MAG: DUF480 domain-containing protein [Halofilum sp. (in: g-proteobacteria)]|nr:DUF480 domain-containing protein [Halofilum sp. (in: g-proteobacteria)]